VCSTISITNVDLHTVKMPVIVRTELAMNAMKYGAVLAISICVLVKVTKQLKGLCVATDSIRFDKL
jgi:hypothetical protein